MKLINLFSVLTLVMTGLASGEDLIAPALKGKLVGVVEGNVTDVTLTGHPEYYVFYASASW